MKTKHVEMMRELRLWGKFGLDVLNTVNQVRLVNEICGITSGIVEKKAKDFKRVRSEKERVYDRLRINKINSIFEKTEPEVLTPEKRAAMMTEEEKEFFHKECAEAMARLEAMDTEVKKLF